MRRPRVPAASVLAAAGSWGLLRSTRPHTAPAACPLPRAPYSAQVSAGHGAVRAAVALDLATPLISSGIAGRCEITTTRTAGQLLTTSGWILQLLAWAFATLFVAGITSAVRKP